MEGNWQSGADLIRKNFLSDQKMVIQFVSDSLSLLWCSCWCSPDSDSIFAGHCSLASPLTEWRVSGTMGQHISTIGTWLSAVWQRRGRPGILSKSWLASRQTHNNRNAASLESGEIILCVRAKHVYHIIMTLINYSLYWLELRMGVLGFWLDNSSNRTRWKVQIQKGIELLRPHQFSWIGSGNSCTTGPGDWVFWGEVCSR